MPKKKASKAGAKRPGFKANAAATAKATARRSKWIQFPPDSTTFIRLMPAWQENGNLFFVRADHYNIQDENGNSVAYACIDHHGGEECPICKVSNYLLESEDGTEVKVGDAISQSKRWVTQAIQRGLEDEGVKLAGFSRTTADKISAKLAQQEELDEDSLADADTGQWVAVQRTGSGRNSTRYDVQTTAKPVPLDDLYPKWAEEFTLDLPGMLRQKHVSADEMIAAMKRKYGDEIDIDSILAS